MAKQLVIHSQWLESTRQRNREDGERIDPVSMAIPDQAMSVKDMVERHARGLPMVGQKVPIYDGDEEMPDLRKMDLSEIAELKEQTYERIQELREKAAEEQQKKLGELQQLKIDYENLKEEMKKRENEKPV